MTDDLLVQIEAALQERETLRQQNAAVGALVAILDEMREQVQALNAAMERYNTIFAEMLADDAGAAVEPLAIDAEKKSASCGRRYRESDAYRWAEALRQGQTQGQVCDQFGLSAGTLRSWMKRLCLDPVTGQPVDGGDRQEEPGPEDDDGESGKPDWAFVPVTREAHFGNVQAIEAAGLMTQHGATLEQAASRYGVDPESVRRAFRRLDMDEDTGKYLKKRAPEKYLEEHDFAR